MIHPTAIVDPKAEIGANVEIGPFSIVKANVTIGDGTFIGPHVTIDPYVEIGPNCQIFSVCVHRGGSPGHQIQGRSHLAQDREGYHHPGIRDLEPGHGIRRRGDGSRGKQFFNGLYPCGP